MLSCPIITSQFNSRGFTCTFRTSCCSTHLSVYQLSFYLYPSVGVNCDLSRRCRNQARCQSFFSYTHNACMVIFFPSSAIAKVPISCQSFNLCFFTFVLCFNLLYFACHWHIYCYQLNQFNTNPFHNSWFLWPGFIKYFIWNALLVIVIPFNYKILPASFIGIIVFSNIFITIYYWFQHQP